MILADLAHLLDHPTAIVGTTGAGKTFAAKGAVEVLLAIGRRVIIIDPTGAWWGLRTGADGNRDGGFPVMIFGGDHADVELTPDGESGKALGKALANRDVRAIIDISSMTGGEKNRFLTPFLEQLYAGNRAPLHLIVDEADEVAAQKPADGEQRLLGIFDKIVRRGRIKGFRPLMITQRPAVIHKNVLSQIGTLIALKLTSPQDRKAIDDWVKGNADAGEARAVMSSLPTLARGEGWVWSPAANVLARTTFPAIKTFDSSRTPTDGETIVQPALTSVDVEALRTAMTIAVTDASVPSARLPSRAEIDSAEQRGFARGLEQGMARGAALVLDAARAASESVWSPLTAQDQANVATPPAARAAVPAVEKSQPVAKAIQRTGASENPLLNAAMQVYPVKMTWAGLAAMCGRKASGGHFNTTRKRLKADGFVREEGDLVILLNPPDAPEGVIPADLLEQNLPQPAQKMFAAIRRSPGIAIDGLAAALGMQPRGGHWNTGMSILRKNGLITETAGICIAEGLEGAKS
ncbi:ATP-binding protein [Neorhizobium lilium]|nr:type IV secretory system conjugative DNA transfer family protein [Neorhizobium lilium]